MASSLAPPSIGIILCSTRQPRVCPQIGAFVTSTISSHLSPSPTSSPASPPLPPATLHPIDLAAWNLPLFDEPGIPSQTSSYAHSHTRAWSLEVQKHAAFIFVLPQYNWGYPAVIKNAIDYLFHEWKAKPAMIVSYGGHGGVKAAAQLKQVLQGVRMDVADTMPALTFPSKEAMLTACKGEPLRLLEEGGIWESEGDIICKGFEEVLALLARK